MSGLIVRGVEVRAGDRALVSDAGFTASRGAVTALIGPNGAGKSTLIMALLGLRHVTAGTVAFEGTDLPAIPPAGRARLCAYVEQSAATAERLTVRDVVALGRVPFQSAWQTMPSRQDEAVVAAAIDELNLADLATRHYHTLSGGEQQRAQIARALAQEPKLLLLDEPTSHLDIAAQMLTLELLHRRSRMGCTVVLALHDLNLAARYCDHLIVLKAGRVVAEGPPADVLTADLLLDVYGVHASIMRLPGTPSPLVVYERAQSEHPEANPIDNGGAAARI